MTYSRFQRVPTLGRGPFVLQPYHGPFSVVVPEATTNLITNPSFETGTTGHTVSTSIATRVTTKQRRGTYSLEVAPVGVPGASNAGMYYAIDLTAGTTYTFSVDFYGYGGGAYKIWFGTTAGAQLVVTEFVGSGRWQRPKATYTETSSTTRRLYVTLNNSPPSISASTALFWVDGYQLEAKAYATTYCDGDQQGFPDDVTPYLWTGTAHASTSTRSAQTRSGGVVKNFDAYKLLVTGIVGLGMLTPTHITTQQALLDGARYQHTTFDPRAFAINGIFDTNTARDLSCNQSLLYADLVRDKVGEGRVLLKYQSYEDRDATGDEVNIQAAYKSGLEGNVSGLAREDVTPQFEIFLPSLYGADQGTSVTTEVSVGSATRTLMRSPGGVWSAMGTGLATSPAVTILIASDAVYYGGPFTSAGGVANTRLIARWTPSTAAWTALGTGATGGSFVDTIVRGPDGTIYATGDFTAMGGVATSAGVASWNGSAWTGLNYPVAVRVPACVVGPTGILYVGDISGNIYKYTGGVWTVIGVAAGGGATISALLIGVDGQLYVGGGFTSISGTPAVNVAQYGNTGTSWSPLGSGLNGTGVAEHGLAAGLDNTIYATSYLSPYIHKYTGSGTWVALGSGLSGVGSGIFIDQNGLLYVYGAITSAGSVTLPDRVASWNGTAWNFLPIKLPGGVTTVYAVARAPDGTFYISYDAAGTALTPGITTVTNSGTLRSYPTITIQGPVSIATTSRIYQIANLTTGRNIYLNYTINKGEMATLVLAPDQFSFTSTFSGDIESTIMPGSAQAFMYLQPGANTIAFFADDSTVVADWKWPLMYQSIADTTYQ